MSTLRLSRPAGGPVLRARALRFAPVALTAVTLLGLWQAAVVLFDVPVFIMPTPVMIAEAFRHDFGTIMSASRSTAEPVLLGLVLGSLGGIAVALVVSRFPRLSGPVLNAAVLINCAPIVALAPIFNNWFGVTSLLSKAGVAAVMVFFPVFVNTTRGLLQIAPLHLEIMESLAAGPRHVAFLLRLPNALPFVFNALKLGTTLAVIGVIVSEYFGGSTEALGVYIAYQAALPRFDYAWAGILVSGAIGLGLFGAVTLLERILMPWHESLHEEKS
ncbi:ABC transporter permease [Streptomyces kebangsaanensis]|uniref:ABC transporter permease n=1 Tax=Streptomyces kebangsaanensis TaxID=864058 RepID=A0ABW6KRS9_9ACTN|nr:ABC transporter permease subunit [Streptomyces kebangsaanensis]